MDYHYLFYSIPLTLIGYQALWFDQFERYFISFAGYLSGDRNKGQEGSDSEFNLEFWLIVSGVLVAVGVLVLIYLVVKWVALSYGAMSQTRVGAVGMLLLLLGIQTMMSALMISMMSVKVDRRSDAAGK
jgi:uncharacterized membrane protein